MITWYKIDFLNNTKVNVFIRSFKRVKTQTEVQPLTIIRLWFWKKDPLKAVFVFLAANTCWTDMKGLGQNAAGEAQLDTIKTVCYKRRSLHRIIFIINISIITSLKCVKTFQTLVRMATADTHLIIWTQTMIETEMSGHGLDLVKLNKNFILQHEY